MKITDLASNRQSKIGHPRLKGPPALHKGGIDEETGGPHPSSMSHILRRANWRIDG